MRNAFFSFLALLLVFFRPVSGYSHPWETIPFKMVGQHAFIQMVAEEKDTLNLIFDTGASTFVLNEILLKKLNLSFDQMVSSTGIGGQREVKIGEIKYLRSGKVSLHQIPAIAASLSHLEVKIGHKIDGIIGYNFLRSHIVRMNYDKMLLEIFDQDEFCPEDYGRSHSIDLSTGIPVLSASVSLNDGSVVSGKFLIDSGAGSGLILNTPLVTEKRLTEIARNAGFQDESTGLNNQPAPYFETVMPGLTFGGYLLQRIPTRLSQGTTGVTAMPEYAGIIGNQILQRFSLVFDYQKEKIYIQPNSRLAHPFPNDASGLKIQLNESYTRIVVNKVIENSPAAHAGLKKGDILLAINDQRLKPEDLPMLKETFSQPGKKIVLTVFREGKAFPVRILLADWFM
ncbi:MAG: aspartyl protease family protein [Bacteroidia bacterium]